MRVLVSLIAVMSLVVVVMFAVAVSHESGRSPQEIGVFQVAVEAAVLSEAACLTCGHDACRDHELVASFTAETRRADIVRTGTYPLKLPLVGVVNDNGNLVNQVYTNGNGLRVRGFPLKLPQGGRTACKC